MRTTVDLPESLLRALKARAGLKKKTLAAEVRELIEAGLRGGTAGAARRREGRSAPPVIRTPRGVAIASLSSAELAKLEEQEDLERNARSSR